MAEELKGLIQRVLELEEERAELYSQLKEERTLRVQQLEELGEIVQSGGLSEWKDILVQLSQMEGFTSKFVEEEEVEEEEDEGEEVDAEEFDELEKKNEKEEKEGKEKTEEQTEEKKEDKAEEKTEDKKEDKTEDKAEEKTEEKRDEEKVETSGPVEKSESSSLKKAAPPPPPRSSMASKSGSNPEIADIQKVIERELVSKAESDKGSIVVREISAEEKKEEKNEESEVKKDNKEEEKDVEKEDKEDEKKEEEKKEEEKSEETKEEKPQPPLPKQPPLPAGRPTPPPPRVIPSPSSSPAENIVVTPSSEGENNAPRPAPPSSRPAPPGVRVAPPGGRAPPGGPKPAIQNPIMNYSDKQLKELAADLFDEKDYLTQLIAPKNQIASLPANVSKLVNLELLDLSQNRFDHIPEEIFSLPKLKKLLLAGNFIDVEKFHPEKEDDENKSWSTLTALEHLDFENSKLKEFPADTFALVSSLTHLNLNRNQLTSIPDQISKLENLQSLLLRWNILGSHEQIQSNIFTENISNLKFLSELNLADNKLTQIPEVIGSLSSLKKLDLSHNKITSIPISIGKLIALQTLNLRDNKITEIPGEIFLDEAFGVQELNFQHNQIREIPLSLWEIDTITYLNFTANKISAIPSEISHLPNLRKLLLGMNKLTSIPAEIAFLEYLEELNISFNRITSLPENLFEGLYSIEKFYCAYNDLEILPELYPDVNQKLWEYFVSGNRKVTALPSSLYSISGISKLYCSDMKLQELPEDLKNLRDLEDVDVSHNEIPSFPITDDDITEIGVIRRLNLSHNKIKSIPRFTPLYDLQNLDFSYNQIEEFDESEIATLLERGVELLLDGNPDSAYAKLKEDQLHHCIHIHASKRFPLVGMGDMIGRRPTMEDALAMVGTYKGDENNDFYGLYDGHAGRETASFCGEHVHNLMLELIDEKRKEGKEVNDELILQCLAESYPRVNKLFKDYLYSDKFTGSSKYCGSTAVSLYIKDNKIYVVNVGDSRAVMCRNQKALRLSYDHKPYGKVEEGRIRSLGGSVIGETGRVNGLLAVSRSIGDFYMHPFVIDEPFSKVYEYGGENDDEFIIIACDGVWDEVADEVAVKLVRKEQGDVFRASCKLRDYAYILGSDDNISVIVVRLK